MAKKLIVTQSKNSNIVTVKAGKNIFRLGDKAKCAYLIESGRVEILVERDEQLTPIAMLGVGDIFGEMAIIDDAPRSATARALDDCELLEVSKEQFNERVEFADPIVKFLIAILLERIRKSIDYRSNTVSTNLINLAQYKREKAKKVAEKVALEKLKLEKDLQKALGRDELFVHYQPIVDMKSNSMAGLEALMRWNSPSRGIVSPGHFMGIAEETSLIVPLGRWIIKESCREFALLKEALNIPTRKRNPFFLSINIAARQFKDPKLFSILLSALKQYHLQPHEIKLEITERVLFEEKMAFDWIKKCRDIGFSIALDDFGTDYSSLNYLSQLDVNNIKIDRSFVQRMDQDKKTQYIIKSIIELCKWLNFTSIAEGVETAKEKRTLKRLGCKLYQGYLFSKPVSIETIIEEHTDQRKRAA